MGNTFDVHARKPSDVLHEQIWQESEGDTGLSRDDSGIWVHRIIGVPQDQEFFTGIQFLKGGFQISFANPNRRVLNQKHIAENMTHAVDQE